MHAGTHFILIPSDLVRHRENLRWEQMRAVRMPDFNPAGIIDILHSEKSSGAIDHTIPVRCTQSSRQKVRNGPSAVEEGNLVHGIHPAFHARSDCAGALNVIPQHHGCKIQAVDTDIQECTAGQFRPDNPLNA